MLLQYINAQLKIIVEDGEEKTGWIYSTWYIVIYIDIIYRIINSHKNIDANPS